MTESVSWNKNSQLCLIFKNFREREEMTDAVLPNASSYIQLYSSDNARPSRQFQIEAKEDYVTFADSKADRPWKMKASAWKFQDAAGLNEFDLRVKIDAGDSERTANAAAAAAASAAATAFDVRAQAAEAAQGGGASPRGRGQQLRELDAAGQGLCRTCGARGGRG